MRRDERSASLSDHHRGRIGVSTDDRRHNRGIRDPEASNAVDAKLIIDHRARIAAHATRADRMIERLGPLADEGADRVIRLRRLARPDLLPAGRIERWGGNTV